MNTKNESGNLECLDLYAGRRRTASRTYHSRTRVLFLAAAVLAWATAASAQQHAINTRNSVLTVRVFKAGVFSAFGHDHEIAAPIAAGTADTTAHHVELRVDAAALRVRDPNISDKDRSEIQQTMLGAEVLDVEHHPEIVFRSTAVEPAGASSWTMRGSLTLHGQTRLVTVDVSEKAGHYLGKAQFKQTEFGIKPVKVAGGTVKVKDEVRIEFDIQLER
jgi:polyisoprenoid-binding protein YceI